MNYNGLTCLDYSVVSKPDSLRFLKQRYGWVVARWPPWSRPQPLESAALKLSATPDISIAGCQEHWHFYHKIGQRISSSASILAGYDAEPGQPQTMIVGGLAPPATLYRLLLERLLLFTECSWKVVTVYFVYKWMGLNSSKLLISSKLNSLQLEEV